MAEPTSDVLSEHARRDTRWRERHQDANEDGNPDWTAADDNMLIDDVAYAISTTGEPDTADFAAAERAIRYMTRRGLLATGRAWE